MSPRLMEPRSSQVSFKEETDIVPPDIDVVTGELRAPARAGKTVIHILDSDEEDAAKGRSTRGTRVKREHSSSPCLDIKSESDERPSAPLSLGSGRQIQKGPHVRHKRYSQQASRPSISAERARSSHALSSHGSSDDNNNHLTPSASPSPSPSSSSASSSGVSDTGMNDDDFRPSRSPSRFPVQSSPTTRSQSRNRQHEKELANSTRATRPIEVIIRSIPRIESGGGPSRVHTIGMDPGASPAGSVKHGWRVVNSNKNGARMPGHSSRDHDEDPDTRQEAFSLGPQRRPSAVTCTNNGSDHIRAVTAGPSTPSCDKDTNRPRSPKGKERAVDPDVHVVIGDSEYDQQQENPLQKEKKKKDNKGQDKDKKSKKEKKRDKSCANDEDRPQGEGKGKGKAIDVGLEQHEEDRTRRPPRLARLEPSIERTPSPGLPTPEPSSARSNGIRYCNHSPGMFVSSPPQPATPGPSRPSAMRNTKLSSASPFSSPIRGASKRPFVEFADLETCVAHAEYNDDSRDLTSSLIPPHECRPAHRGRKRVRMREYQEQVAAFKGLIIEQDRRLAEVEAVVSLQAVRLAEVEAIKTGLAEDVKSLKEHVNEAKAQMAQGLGSRVATSGEVSTQQRPATTRPLQREIPPTQFYSLDLNRRNGLNPPRAAPIPNTLVRSRSGPNGQQLASQNRARKEIPQPRPRNAAVRGPLPGPGSNNNGDSRRRSEGAVFTGGSHHVVPAVRNPGLASGRPQQPVLNHVSSMHSQGLKDQVVNHPLSNHQFSIPYDDALDMQSTSKATHFLLHTPQHQLLERLKSAVEKHNFFDDNHPYNRTKGCWTATEGKTVTVTSNGESHEYSLPRLAARLWLAETSVLRLLSDRKYQVRSACHNNRCFHPHHVVVESSKEYNERLICKRAGACTRHKFKSKTDDRYRRRCVLRRVDSLLQTY